MKKVYQNRFGGSEATEEEQGNCLQAVLASIFDIPLEYAPDFTGQIESFEWHTTLQGWLSKRNLVMVPMAVIDGYPLGIHILACESTTLAHPEDGHVVVVENGNIIHDPNPNSQGEGKREQYWVMACLDPSKQQIYEV